MPLDLNAASVIVNYNNRTCKSVIHDLLVKYGKDEIVYIIDQCVSEIEKNSYDEINRIAIESKLIIEQFQKLLGVYTTTEAFGKIAVIMREESEIEAELNKYKKLVNSIYEIVSVNCTDVGEAFAGIQNDIEELRDKCPAVTDGVHLWTVNGFDETRLCKHCGTRR